MLERVIGHKTILDTLKQKLDPLPPVLLFNGPPKVGKVFTALNLIDEIYKGSIQNRLLNHSDILLLESDTKIFKVELIERLKEALSFTPFELDRKFYILRQVDKMNKESFNRCLKILEDRNSTDYFILTSNSLELIPKTILSRCVLYNFYPIPDLSKYFPQLSELQIRVMQGCPGNLSLFENIDLTNLYRKLHDLLENIEKFSYSNLIEFFDSVKNIDLSIIINMFGIVSLDTKNLKAMEKVSLLKGKITHSIYPEMHFKEMLYDLK